MTLGRRWIGAIIGAVGAVLCAASAYIAWYAGKAPADLSITQLVRASVSGPAADYWTSLAAPFAILGMVGVVGALLRSRLLLGLGWMGGAACLALWGIMRFIGVATDSAPPDARVGVGVWVCVGGLLILFIGVVVMGPRREEVEAPLSVFDDDDPPW